MDFSIIGIASIEAAAICIRGQSTVADCAADRAMSPVSLDAAQVSIIDYEFVAHAMPEHMRVYEQRQSSFFRSATDQKI
jgi:hypothetical protein